MKIDFVVTWLDSNDPEWQSDIRKYKTVTVEGDQSNARFRDWDLFRYWFRSVERYAPWVNRIFLVTNGKFPDWINTNHPKLVLVKHSDYIPEEFLPTFNSHTIELNMGKIPGLSEHFVYFNDDFYLNSDVTPDYYFREDLPCDENAETVYNVGSYDPISKFTIKIINFTNICVLNGHFSRKETIKRAFWKWNGFHLGLVDRIMNVIISMDPSKRFVGFRERHFEQPFLKSAFEDAWEVEAEMLKKSCTRFREDTNLSPYFIRYWQFATNKFYPVKLKSFRKLRLIPDEFHLINKTLNDLSIKSVCLNDTPLCTEEKYEEFKPVLQSLFAKKFPNKSTFEK